MPVLLVEDQNEASRSATERDHDGLQLHNADITGAFSQGNVNGHGLDQNLNVTDHSDGTLESEAEI